MIDALRGGNRKASGHYSGYVPDLPGCVATGDTPEDTENELPEAIHLHIAGLREDGLPVPDHTTIRDDIKA